YINGEPRQEPYASSPLYRISAIKVPDGKLFVLGDNRNNSADGHVWGFLPAANVEAKIIFRFWPVTRIGMLE
ncbi:MAG: signal peptidase I, partial [Candidatus Vecturithrix sp.]|nr:signal peptidase I [Candidatus Vecturithrix sp.]